MKVLVDVGVGRAVEQWLRRAGHDVISIRDIEHDMSDDQILSLALQESRVVLTMDKDFGDLVYGLGLNHTGVLLLRLEDADSATKTAVVAEVFTRFADDLPGHFSVYQRGQLRIRR